MIRQSKGDRAMQYRKHILGGVCTALLMWGIVMLCDIIDEYVLDTSDGLAAAAFFIAPVALFVWYIVHCIKSKPEGEESAYLAHQLCDSISAGLAVYVSRREQWVLFYRSGKTREFYGSERH